ncbi:hypothetical protein NHX12_014548 [Muraenolepis orangiensis]|uniref:Glycerol-3-phosphate dehydrogenase, mitochondrial n=1 Tax=Muraenolepis orangiensis TaxID=630683 RepID=A0A9Q0I279_9TELE|nr:hypothetical protein NHX12_014548 [Muraenolepis orangiensis]
MAEETLDAAIKTHQLEATASKTVGLTLEGGRDWSPTLYIRLVQDYGLENEVAQHLASTYGGRAFEVAKMAQVTGKRWPIVGKRLVSEFPYIEGEVLYAIQEYACTAIDIIARRTRLGFLNVQAADEALPRIVEIMGKKLNWCGDRKTVQKPLPQRVLQIDENALHEILNEVDLNKNGQVEIDEFLQLMSAVKKGQVSDSRLAILLKTAEESLDLRAPVSVDRSGGGV